MPSIIATSLETNPIRYPLVMATKRGRMPKLTPRIMAKKVALRLLKKIKKKVSIRPLPSTNSINSSINTIISALKKTGNVNPIKKRREKIPVTKTLYQRHSIKNFQHL
jgi:hypothetical protein